MSNEKGKGFNFNSLLLIVLVGLGGWNLLETHNALVKNTELQGKLDAVTERLESYTRNRWTAAHMQLYSDKLEKLNPTVKTPDSFEIQKSYTQ